MITITVANHDYRNPKDVTFYDAWKAFRFIKAMRSKGCRILGYECYDPEDNEILSRA